jgi:hypothetical protein
MTTTPATRIALTDLPRIDTPPERTRRGRCHDCDAAFAYKTAASHDAGCPRCGGTLATTTRNLKSSRWYLLAGSDLELALRVPGGLAGRIAWELERAELTEARVAALEADVAADPASYEVTETLIAGKPDRTIWTLGPAWNDPTKLERKGGYRVGGMLEAAARNRAKAAKLERALARLGGPLA